MYISAWLVGNPGAKLPIKQRRFVEKYIEGRFNATAAYKAAGYRAKNNRVAQASASKLLSKPMVADYLTHLLRMAAQAGGEEIKRADVIRELTRIAYASITQVLRWDESGHVTVTPSSDLSPDVAAAIKSVKATRTVRRRGGREIEKTVIEVTMHDKLAALAMLARAADLFTPDGGTGRQKVIFHLDYTGRTRDNQSVERVLESEVGVG